MEQKPLEARLQLTESERERLYAAARASRMSTNRYLTHITRQALGKSRKGATSRQMSELPTQPPTAKIAVRRYGATRNVGVGKTNDVKPVVCGVEWIARGRREMNV